MALLPSLFIVCYSLSLKTRSLIMKQLFLLSLMMILLPGATVARQAETMQKSPATSSTASTPESVVKDFYRWYIGRLNLNKDPLSKEKAALGKYITPEFLRKAPK